MSMMCKLVNENRFGEAEKINQTLDELHHILFVESNPIPVKYLLNKMGLIDSGIRLPLIQLSSEFHSKFEKYV
jgi:4-hydroxy-tetrahydrodipicolinate synthase